MIAAENPPFVLERKSAFLVALFSLPLLFLPKINLIVLGGGETAGLRLDDIILLFISMCILWAHGYSKNGFFKIEAIVLTITSVSLFSFFFNRVLVELGILHLEAKLFYCVRILEYFLFFYIGVFTASLFDGRKVIVAFLVWNVAIMTLQKLGILGEFSSLYGYQIEASYRASGIASFPSEMGALLNVLFCFFLFAPKEKGSVLWDCCLFILFGGLIIMTGSRIALAALLIPFVFKLWHEAKSGSALKLITVGVAISGVLLALFAALSQADSIAERSSGLFSWRNVELMGDLWKRVNSEAQVVETSLQEGIKEGTDLSWWIRIHKWVYVLKVYVSHPECYLQGIGPGCAWAALDGGWLRVLVEMGIVGVILYGMLFKEMCGVGIQMKWIGVAVMINMIFFDAYLAYKLMSLFFLIGGMMSRGRVGDSVEGRWLSSI